MRIPATYYLENLYPFQDGILKIVNESGAPLYLTGGTALSRKYTHHRFSDDLDFFFNAEPGFDDWVGKVFTAFENARERTGFSIDRNLFRKEKDFMQVYLTREDSVLKIDFVNDVAVHFGEIEYDPVLGKVDSWRNILSNKIAALSRFEAKDLADIWAIAKIQPFSWRMILAEALEKEVGLEPDIIAGILSEIPTVRLSAVKWVQETSPAEVLADLKIIAADILKGADNSLCPARI